MCSVVEICWLWRSFEYSCRVPGTSLRWFELCDMVSYFAGSSCMTMGTLWWDGRGQQQYSGRLRLNNAQLGAQENIPHTSASPAAWTLDTRKDESMLSCCLHQILTLPSTWTEQATFLQFWWACTNCWLTFLFLADMSDPRCGPVLRMPICSAFKDVLLQLLRSARSSLNSALTSEVNKAFKPLNRYFLFFRTLAVKYSDQPVWLQSLSHPFKCSIWPKCTELLPCYWLISNLH